MAEERQHLTAEELHTAMDKIGGFVYQFYCFLYHVLTMNKGEEVSFEKLDDAAIESGNLITLLQAKHTVRVSADGQLRQLTNRSSDMWKALDVWRELIVGKESENRTKEEKEEYIRNHKFVFVSNKQPAGNKIVSLCEEVKTVGQGESRIDQVLDEIINEGRPSSVPADSQTKTTTRTVQMMIDDLKGFDLRESFLKNVVFETITQDEIKAKCIEHITDRVRFSEEDADSVFDDFLTEAVKDFFDKANVGESLGYTYEEQKKRFERVFQYHREEPLDFRIEIEQYKKEFLDLVCIQQLIRVKDLAASETEKVAKYASHYLSFKNRYDKLKEDSKILESEDELFRADAITFWENEVSNAYDGMNDNASEEDVVKKAKKLLYEVRKHQLTLRQSLLILPISNGAFYYLSDECIIGWHKNWRDFFSKQTMQNGQTDKQ